MSCLLYVINIIYKYNIYSLEYEKLFKLYTFLCTNRLNTTQYKHKF